MNKYRCILSSEGEEIDFETFEAKSARAALKQFLALRCPDDVDEEELRAYDEVQDTLDGLEKLSSWLWSTWSEEGTFFIVKC
jgi:hypothetical protein